MKTMGDRVGEVEIQRDLGGLEADMKTVKAQVAAMDAKLDKLALCMASAKGGYKALLAIGAAAGAAGGLLVKVVPFIGVMR